MTDQVRIGEDGYDMQQSGKRKHYKALTEMWGTKEYFAPELIDQTYGPQVTHTPLSLALPPPPYLPPLVYPPPPLDNYMPFTHPTTHSSRSSLTRSRPSLDYLSQADLWALGCILFEMLCGHQVTDALPLLPPSAWGYYINSQPSLIEMLCGHQVTERPHTQLCIFFPLSLPVTLSLSLFLLL